MITLHLPLTDYSSMQILRRDYLILLQAILLFSFLVPGSTLSLLLAVHLEQPQDEFMDGFLQLLDSITRQAAQRMRRYRRV